MTMRRTFLKAKLHNAVVTGANLEYHGSITLDPVFLREAGIVPWERIEVYNSTNGERFATYVILGREGAREVVINGAAAHKASPGDRVILATYCELEEDEIAGHEPRVLIMDEENRIAEVRDGAHPVVG